MTAQWCLNQLLSLVATPRIWGPLRHAWPLVRFTLKVMMNICIELVSVSYLDKYFFFCLKSVSEFIFVYIHNEFIFNIRIRFTMQKQKYCKPMIPKDIKQGIKCVIKTETWLITFGSLEVFLSNFYVHN